MKHDRLLRIGWCLVWVWMLGGNSFGKTMAWWRFETVSSNIVDASDGKHSGIMRNMNAGMDDGQSGYSSQVPGTLITDGISTNVNLYCLRFDGVNDYVDITNNLSGLSMESSPSAFTIECFFRVTAPTFPMRFLHMINRADTNGPPTTISPHFSTWGTPPFLAMSLNSDLATQYITVFATDLNPSPVMLDMWHHVAWVKKEGALRFYLDYQLINTRTESEMAGAYTGFDLVNIGAISYSPNFFSGYLDEMRFSDRALAPSQFLHVVGGLRPAFRAISRAGDSVNLTLVTESGTVYQVQSSPLLSPGVAEWSNAAEAVTGALFYTTIPVSAPQSMRYYRVLRNP